MFHSLLIGTEELPVQLPMETPELKNNDFVREIYSIFVLTHPEI
jgi:hypothetical protein